MSAPLSEPLFILSSFVAKIRLTKFLFASMAKNTFFFYRTNVWTRHVGLVKAAQSCAVLSFCHMFLLFFTNFGLQFSSSLDCTCLWTVGKLRSEGLSLLPRVSESSFTWVALTCRIICNHWNSWSACLPAFLYQHHMQYWAWKQLLQDLGLSLVSGYKRCHVWNSSTQKRNFHDG